MKKAGLLVAAMMLILPMVAKAHGPSRQKVVETVQIAAPPAKVWEIIKNFNDMSWHPAVKKTDATGNNEAGATRVLTLGNGGQINEKLDSYDATAMTYHYEITDVNIDVLPVANYTSWLTVKPADGGSTVEWKGAFYRGYMNNDPPPQYSDDAANAAVVGVYQGGLQNLKKLAEKK